MINRKFKTFETIARFRKLYEADEMEQDPAADPSAERIKEFISIHDTRRNRR